MHSPSNSRDGIKCYVIWSISYIYLKYNFWKIKIHHGCPTGFNVLSLFVGYIIEYFTIFHGNLDDRSVCC